jgi:hypothetical protein
MKKDGLGEEKVLSIKTDPMKVQDKENISKLHEMFISDYKREIVE